MSIGMIVAVAENGVIGKGNGIPWFYKGDLKWFKETTKNAAVVMGRKTWESLPKKPLPKRLNVVVTKSDRSKFEGATVTRSLRQALATCEAEGYRDIWLIGGGGIYREGIDIADVIFVTKIPEVIETDDTTVYFPEIDEDRWTIQGTKPHPYVPGLIIEAWGLLPTEAARKIAVREEARKALRRGRK